MWGAGHQKPQLRVLGHASPLVLRPITRTGAYTAPHHLPGHALLLPGDMAATVSLSLHPQNSGGILEK